MSQKRPRWEHEMFASRGPNAVACATCQFRSTVAEDGGILDHAGTDTCEIYQFPDSKPEDVYYDGAECEFYEPADDKPLSLLLGVAVGDALGVPVEFKKRGTFHVAGMQGYGTHNQPPGTWSDDTSLTLALADNLLPDRCSLESIATGLQLWYFNAWYTPHGKVFDVGNATAKAIKRLKDGVTPEKAGGTGEKDNGNGSLMRISPLTFYMYGVWDRANRYEIVKRVSSMTHAHEWSVTACFIYVEMLNKILKGRDKKQGYAELRDDFSKRTPFISQEALAKFDRILGGDISKLGENDIRSSGFVVDTLEAALWCFFTTENYRDAVLKAVNLGDDTDTTGAVTGALAGLAYGTEGIPKEWVKQLAGYEEIQRIAQEMPRWDYFRSPGYVEKF